MAAPLILIVDDEPDIREVIAEMLLLDGYRVRTASNGKLALERARGQRPDLIVLDLMMPVMNGWEFLEAKRADPELAAIPVMIVTAGLDQHVRGAAVLLRKPFDIAVFLEKVGRFFPGGPEHFEQPSA
jgi:CheY-like chemotaxis protein